MASPQHLAQSVASFMKRDRRWVIFEHGTVVVIDDPSVDDPVDYARLKLESDSSERAGSAAGDFSVTRLDGTGWVVSTFDPDIFTFVPKDEVDDGAPEVIIGMAGRVAFGADRDGLNVVHVAPTPTA